VTGSIDQMPPILTEWHGISIHDGEKAPTVVAVLTVLDAPAAPSWTRWRAGADACRRGHGEPPMRSSERQIGAQEAPDHADCYHSGEKRVHAGISARSEVLIAAGLGSVVTVPPRIPGLS
jgi:hypothetical protein